MSIDNNTFCWFGIATDMDAGRRFYPQVLGWTLVDTDDGLMFVGPGGAVAHIQPPQGPPSWCCYLSVDDLDARTALAAANGTVLVPPTPLAIGRFSVVMSPTGAVLGLYEATPSDALAAPGPGSVHQVDVQSTAAEADRAWLREAFALDHTWQADGAPQGGVVDTAAPRSSVVAWVQVADLKDTLQKVQQHGGAMISGGEDRAIVADPGGAQFGLVQLSA